MYVVVISKAESDDKVPRETEYGGIQNGAHGWRGFAVYTLFRGGKLGIVVRSICLTFRVVNGGYRALRMDSILEIER